MKAMRRPSREKRGELSQVAVSYNTLPTGYSRRYRPATLRATARPCPSEEQSASWTSLSTWRGTPPDKGARASVPERIHPVVKRGSRRSAISPDADTERISPDGRPSALDSGLPGRVENSSAGWPSQEAE